MNLPPFHLAIPVRNIEESREFYGRTLGFAEGRSDIHWVDFNMYGHQLVIHLDTSLGEEGKRESTFNPVDGDAVPIPHFGLVLDMPQWQDLAERLRYKISEFLIEPHIRFAGEPGEQATMFFLDPSGNALEFKAFKDVVSELFAK